MSRYSIPKYRETQTSIANPYLDVPLEVSKSLVSYKLQPKYIPIISRWNNPFTNHLLSSWDILVPFKTEGILKTPRKKEWLQAAEFFGESVIKCL